MAWVSFILNAVIMVVIGIFGATAATAFISWVEGTGRAWVWIAWWAVFLVTGLAWVKAMKRRAARFE